MVDAATSNNLKCIMMDVLVLYGDLTQENIASKLITFGVDRMSVFQGVKIGVTVQLKTQNALFMIGVHCMSHCTNLAMQTLSKMGIVGKI